ncbi:MAG TPA: hypothetical protein VHU85_00900 [Acidimicrobiales bacterium]|jgi:hypothetical protein|nr:hypothetical protein [Acidimicrobiales bacterium]
MDLDAIADELYGLSPDDFTSTRNQRENEAKGAGDKELAGMVHRLPKPNGVAWLVNQLARQHRADIQGLLELGSDLRQATANRPGDLRELSRRQRGVIGGLVQQAEQLAEAAGRPVSAATARSLEETFYAVLADPDAADIVAAGRLATGLNPAGFAGTERTGSPGRASATKPPPKVEKRSPAGERPNAKALKLANSKVTQAKSAARKAIQARDKEYARLQRAEQRVADAGDRVEQLRRELEEAVEAQSKAEKDHRGALAAFDRADRGEQRAQRDLADAAEAQERLAP